MKSVLAALVISALSTVIVAQSIADLPECAQGCVGTTISVPGCQPIDIRCICSAREFLQNISCCLASACSKEEQAKAVKLAGDLCSTAGVSVPNQVVCPSGSAAPESTTSSTSAAPASESVSAAATSETPSGSTTPTSESHSSAAGTGVSGGVYPTPTGNGNSTIVTAATPSGPTSAIAPSNAAAPVQAGAGLSLVGMIAAMIALF